MWTAVRILFRRILSQRWGAVAIVASLAVGIGLNGAMYALYRATFVSPYAFDQRHRLVEICQQERGSPIGNCIDSRPDLQDLREAGQTFAAITAYHVHTTFLLLGNDEQEVQGTDVDPDFTAVMGIRPQYGRMFVPEDFAHGAPLVAILSYTLWQASFLGNPRILGSVIHISDKDVRVVGIMPPGFAFPFGSAAFGAKGTGVWMPSQNRNELRTMRNLSAAALLKRGVSVRQLQVEASAIALRLANLHPEDKEYTFDVHGLGHDLQENFGKTAEIAGIISALILILAVLNVSGILMAEHLRRGKEWQIAAMLGATRWHLLRPFLAQSLALSFAGGMVGAWLAALFLRMARNFLASQLVHAGGAAVDWRVLAFIVTVSAAAGVTSGMWPLLVADLRASLGERAAPYRRNRESGPGATARARRVLVIVQVGGATALLSFTGMLLAHMRAVAATDVGFRVDHLVNFVWTSAKPSWNGVALLKKNLEAIPGVESVAFTQNTPLAGGFVQKFLLSGNDPRRQGTEYAANFNGVSSDYFRVLGIPLHAGRFFSEQEERPGETPTVVVNEAFVRRFSPTLPVLGQRLCTSKEDKTPCDWLEIVGVAGDVRDSGIFDPPDPTFYLPWRQSSRPMGANVCLRTRIAPEAVLDAVRKAVARTSSADHAFFIETVENIVRKQASAGIVILYGAAVAALASILLAAAGLYGTLSNLVSQSRREIGIRMAIGATPRTTAWHFIEKTGKWVASGLSLGVFGAIGMNQSARAAVYGLPFIKLWVLGSAVTVVILVSLLALLLPLREAARLDPADALRHE